MVYTRWICNDRIQLHALLQIQWSWTHGTLTARLFTLPLIIYSIVSGSTTLQSSDLITKLALPEPPVSKRLPSGTLISLKQTPKNYLRLLSDPGLLCLEGNEVKQWKRKVGRLVACSSAYPGKLWIQVLKSFQLLKWRSPVQAELHCYWAATNYQTIHCICVCIWTMLY